MEYLKYAALVLTFWAVSAEAAGDYTIKINAVRGKEVYNYTHIIPAAEQSNYAGKVRGKPGVTRQIILNTLAAKQFGGGIKLQYMFELADPADSASPPLELVSEVALSTGVKTMVARGGGWVFYITADGPSYGEIKKNDAANYLLKVDLTAGKKKFPLTMAVTPGTQLTQMVIENSGQEQVKYTFTARPDKPAFAGGEFSMPYSFTVKVNGQKTAEGSGEARIKPGDKKGTVITGKGWKLLLGTREP